MHVHWRFHGGRERVYRSPTPTFEFQKIEKQEAQGPKRSPENQRLYTDHVRRAHICKSAAPSKNK